MISSCLNSWAWSPAAEESLQCSQHLTVLWLLTWAVLADVHWSLTVWFVFLRWLADHFFPFCKIPFGFFFLLGKLIVKSPSRFFQLVIKVLLNWIIQVLLIGYILLQCLYTFLLVNFTVFIYPFIIYFFTLDGYWWAKQPASILGLKGILQ